MGGAGSAGSGARARAAGAAALIVWLAACPGRIDDPEAFRAAEEQLGTCELDVPTDVLAARCASSGCHDASEPAAGLDLVSPGVAERLIGVPSTQCEGRVRAHASDPAMGVLLEKLHGMPECGAAMPIGGEALSREEIACVEQWLEDAAAAAPADAGADGGMSPADGGTSPADGGTSPADGGTPPADGGVAAVDGGADGGTP